jgi:hypothetical protein
MHVAQTRRRPSSWHWSDHGLTRHSNAYASSKVLYSDRVTRIRTLAPCATAAVASPSALYENPRLLRLSHAGPQRIPLTVDAAHEIANPGCEWTNNNNTPRQALAMVAPTRLHVEGSSPCPIMPVYRRRTRCSWHNVRPATLSPATAVALRLTPALLRPRRQLPGLGLWRHCSYTLWHLPTK